MSVGPTQRSVLPSADRLDSNLGVHALSEFVFCPRAGLLTHEGRPDDDGFEDEIHIPNLSYQPDYVEEEIELALAQRIQHFWMIVTWLPVGLLVAYALYVGEGSIPFIVVGLTVIGFAGWHLYHDVSDILLLKRRLHAAQTAGKYSPRRDHSVPEQLNWWQLIKAGYTCVKLQGHLRDHSARLIGKPWRILHKGGVRIPVFLCRQDKENRKIYRKHEIRMAAYCHLIATAEQAKAPYGLILFAGTYDAVTVPITDKHVAQLREEVAKAREIIQQQERNRQQPQRPLNESICAGCHHGEPKKYEAGVTEVKLGEVVLAPFLTEDVDGQRDVSNCGTRYRWVPRHKQAVALRMTD